MSVNRDELERLLALKKMQEELRTQKKELDELQLHEKTTLDRKYKQFASLTSQAMKEQLDQQLQVSATLSTKKATVKSDELDLMLEDYNNLYPEERCSKEPWYKKPEMKDGKMELAFPSEKAMTDFFEDQSSKNRAFMVVDAQTNKVMAYSNGDGKLYHGNGTEFKSGDKLTPSGVDLAQFQMPEPEVEQRSSMGMR